MYQGAERRMTHDCIHEDDFKKMAVEVAEIKGDVKLLNARINGSLEKIASHMEEGIWYRRLVIGTAVSLILSIMGGIYTASTISATLGRYMERVDINTERWRKLIDTGNHGGIR
jgi:hypothetical protein